MLVLVDVVPGVPRLLQRRFFYVYGAEPAATAEAFPGRVRCSSAAISHNICFAVLGGTAPMVATYLIVRTQNDLSPSIYLMAAALISIIAILSLSETAKAPLA